MAKIDTTKIEGYAGMTAEQKLAALEAYDHPDPDYTGYVKKELYDKAASDAADWKKKHNALLSEDERKKQTEAEEVAGLKKRVAELESEKTVSEYKAKYIAQGYSEDLAAATAKALAEGDTTTVFANQQKFLEEYAKTVKADALKKTPRPAPGAGGKSLTVDEFRKLSPRERYEFSQKYPEEYKSMYGGNE